jgi:hypothetical protein
MAVAPASGSQGTDPTQDSGQPALAQENHRTPRPAGGSVVASHGTLETDGALSVSTYPAPTALSGQTTLPSGTKPPAF